MTPATTTMPAELKTVLVLDEEDSSRERTRRAFAGDGWSVATAADPPSALALLDHSGYSVVVTELRIKGRSAFELLPEIRHRRPQSQVWIATDYPSVATAVRAVKQGFDAYHTKPLDLRSAGNLLTQGPGQAESTAQQWPSLDRTIWEFINQVFAASGTMTEAARRLHLDRRSLRRMLSKYPPAR